MDIVDILSVSCWFQNAFGLCLCIWLKFTFPKMMFWDTVCSTINTPFVARTQLQLLFQPPPHTRLRMSGANVDRGVCKKWTKICIFCYYH